MAEWQRQASHKPGKRARMILAAGLITLMIVVLWFSWSAGEQLKLVSAVVGAAVAFLGQIGSAFNFMRSNVGAAGSGSRQCDQRFDFGRYLPSRRSLSRSTMS